MKPNKWLWIAVASSAVIIAYKYATKNSPHLSTQEASKPRSNQLVIKVFPRIETEGGQNGKNIIPFSQRVTIVGIDGTIYNVSEYSGANGFEIVNTKTGDKKKALFGQICHLDTVDVLIENL